MEKLFVIKLNLKAFSPTSPQHPALGQKKAVVVNRFKEEPVYELSPNWPLVEVCRLIVESWPIADRWMLVEVQLYFVSE